MPYALKVDGLGEIRMPEDASEIDMMQRVITEKIQAGQMHPTADIAQEVDRYFQAMNRPPEPTEFEIDDTPDRGLIGEIAAGIGSGAVGTIGAALSGQEEAATAFGLADRAKTYEEKGWIGRLGQRLEDYAGTIEPSKDTSETLWGLSNAVGSFTGMVAVPFAATVGATLAGASAGITVPLGLLVTGALATGANADEAYDKAVAFGANWDDVDKVTRHGYGYGIAELTPALRGYSLIKKIDKAADGVLKSPHASLAAKAKARAQKQNDGLIETLGEDLRKAGTNTRLQRQHAKNLGKDVRPLREYGKDIARTMGFEGSQEFAVAVAQNASERAVYNPEAELVNSEAIQEGLYGGGAGAIWEATMMPIVRAFAPRKSRIFRKKMDEFQASTEYKNLKTQAEDAARDFDEAGNDLDKRDEAEARFNKVNEMMTVSLRDNVYNTEEIVEYLRASGAYSDEYIDAARQSNNGLKILYNKHVLDPRTQYESDTDDIIYNTVDPYSETGETYTYEGVEALKKAHSGIKPERKGKFATDYTHTGINFEGEVKARRRDIERGDSIEIQKLKIQARTPTQRVAVDPKTKQERTVTSPGVSWRKLNEIQDKYGDQALTEYLTLLNEGNEFTWTEKGKTVPFQKKLDAIVNQRGLSGLQGIRNEIKARREEVIKERAAKKAATEAARKAKEAAALKKKEEEAIKAANKIKEKTEKTAKKNKKEAEDAESKNTGTGIDARGGIILYDKKGNIIDADGNRLDEEGNIIEEEGEGLDEEGEGLDEEGEGVGEGTDNDVDNAPEDPDIPEAETGTPGMDPARRAELDEGFLGVFLEKWRSSNFFNPSDEGTSKSVRHTANIVLTSIKENGLGGWSDTLAKIYPAPVANSYRQVGNQALNEFKKSLSPEEYQQWTDGLIQANEQAEAELNNYNETLAIEENMPLRLLNSDGSRNKKYLSEEDMNQIAEGIVTTLGATTGLQMVQEDVRKTKYDPNDPNRIVLREYEFKDPDKAGGLRRIVFQQLSTEETSRIHFRSLGSYAPDTKTIYLNINPLNERAETRADPYQSPVSGIGGTTLEASQDPLFFMSNVLGSAYHETYHAIKRLSLANKPEIFEAIGKNITLELARKNGWPQDSYAFKDKDILQEEAEAFMFGKWAAGKELVGLEPMTRQGFDKVREFVNRFINLMQGKGFVVGDKKFLDWSAEQNQRERIEALFTALRTGELARKVGSFADPAAGAAYSQAHLPSVVENILSSETTQKVFNGLRQKGLPTGATEIEIQWKNLKDISNFEQFIRHLSGVSQQSPIFRPVYNFMQKRVGLRNDWKGSAEVIAEQAGLQGGIFQLSNADAKQILQLHALADEAGVDPIFRNIRDANASAEIRFDKDALDEIRNRYGDIETFLEDSGIELGVGDGALTVTEDGASYIINDAKIASAYAGTSSAIKFMGEKKFLGLLNNFLRTSGFGDWAANIDTSSIIKARTGVDALKKAGREAGFIRSRKHPVTGKEELLFDKKAYKTHLEATKGDGVFGNLPPQKAADTFEVLNAIVNERRKGYFPHYQYGDNAVGVYEVTIDDKGNQVKTLRRMETAESGAAELWGGTPVVGDVLKKKVLKSRDAIHKRLAEHYGATREEIVTDPDTGAIQKVSLGDGIEIRNFPLTMDALRKMPGKEQILKSMSKIDIMSDIYNRHGDKKEGGKGERDKQVGGLANMIRAELAESRAQALTRERRNIPGWLTRANNDGKYFKLSFQRFIDSSANIASSLMVEPDLLNAITELERAHSHIPDSNLVKLANKTFEYINNPNNEATQLRSYAFHFYLGTNLSSAMVNLTQTVQSTYPILASVIGTGKGGVEVLRAGKDAMALWKYMHTGSKKAPRLGKYGFEFFKSVVDENGNVTAEIDMDRKPPGMPEKEFRFLARLFQKGTIQPIQNMDLGAGEVSKRLSSKVTRGIVDTSGYAFGMIENINRITAALAFYRAAQNPSNRSKFTAFTKGTRFGEQDLSALGVRENVEVLDSHDNETGVTETIDDFAELVGEMGVEKTQFFMGKENRPRVMRGPIMSVVSQFQTFLWQMIGTYATAMNHGIGRKLPSDLTADERILLKSMARKQFALMTMTLMVFGGMMGLPFMENLKELIKFLSENFGDEVAFDFEQGIREELAPIMGYTATDMMLRGAVRGMGLDISRRTTFGEVLPLRMFLGGDPVDFAGPAISRMWDTVQGINNNLEQGDYTGAVAAALPVAMANMYKAAYLEPNYGTFTQRGRQLLPPGKLTSGEMAASFFGFTPAVVGRARSRVGIENYYQYRSRNHKEVLTQRMTRAMGGYLDARKRGDFERAMEYYADYRAAYQKALRHDADNTDRPDKQYNINPETVFKRVARTQGALGRSTGPKVRKSVQPIIQEGIDKGFIPTA